MHFMAAAHKVVLSQLPPPPALQQPLIFAPARFFPGLRGLSSITLREHIESHKQEFKQTGTLEIS